MHPGPHQLDYAGEMSSPRRRPTRWPCGFAGWTRALLRAALALPSLAIELLSILILRLGLRGRLHADRRSKR